MSFLPASRMALTAMALRGAARRLPPASTSTWLPPSTSRTFSTEKRRDKEEANELKRMEGESLAKYFKRLTRDYWYVLVPVHLATSAVWMGAFYLMIKSGVDIGAALERMGTSHEKVGIVEVSASPSYVKHYYYLIIP